MGNKFEPCRRKFQTAITVLLLTQILYPITLALSQLQLHIIIHPSHRFNMYETNSKCQGLLKPTTINPNINSSCIFRP